MKKILYISYDGMTDPLGQSQVLSYMQKLSNKYEVSIISSEKKDRYKNFGKEIRDVCAKSGINWHPLLYTKSPPVLSTLYDVWNLMRKSKRLNRKEKFDIVHCRSYISSIIGLQFKKKYGTAFIFDMRGFWVDERIEGGGWNQNSFLYKLVIKYFRRKEQQFYEHSDVIVTLTQASKRAIELIQPDIKLKIRVIPTCVNLDVFKSFDPSLRNKIRDKMGIPKDAFVLLYSGGFGANYNISFLLQVYNKIKQDKPGACILILSKDGVTGLEQEKNAGKIFSISLPYSQVGEYLMAGDIGVINYNNHFSVAGRSPTKLGEYWACGLPAIAPKGVGDVDYLFTHYDKSGVLYDEATFCHELNDTLKVKRDTLRSYAEEYFGLDNGVKMYDTIYENLTAHD